MRAVRYDRYGPPEVLHVSEVPVPEAEPGEVLVEVRASSAGGGEPAIRAGKLRRVMRNSFPQGLGNDFVGIVARTGSGIHGLRAGDAVWGLLPHGTFGSLADYVVVPESRLAPAPKNLSFVEAAALPVPGTTALTALTEKARLAEGERLLVRGATGGVGSIAVQLGKALGAHVTALAGAGNLDWVKELGADTALDYRTTRLEDLDRFDVILDAVGTDIGAYRKRLTRSGRMVELAFDEDHLVSSFASVAWNMATGPRKMKAFSNNPSAERIAELTRYVESGAIRPVVDTVYPLASIAEAHRRLEAGGMRGRLVIDMQQPAADSPSNP
jgi:NADPH:quinone reductase-like Zn-dependent oxidoreductase